MIGLAVRRWACQWTNASVVIHTDNITARCALNKGKSKSPLAMAMVREIFWLATAFNFKIRAVHIPGVENVLADAISRMHDHKFIGIVGSHMGFPCRGFSNVWLAYFLLHMSYKSFLAICGRLLQCVPLWEHVSDPPG